jgi:hypothetical protein
VCHHEPRLSKEVKRLAIPLKAFFRLELARYLHSCFNEEDSHTSNAAHENMTRKEADEYAQSKVAEQQKDDAGKDGREGKGDNGSRHHGSGVLITQYINDDGDENVVKGHHFNHHAAIATSKDGSTQAEDELADDAGDKEHRHSISTKVGKDGIRCRKDNETIRDAIKNIEQQAQDDGW